MLAQGGRIVLAIDGAAAVGCLQLNVLHGVSLLGQSRAQVEGVRVAASSRNQGVGAALMNEATRRARAEGCGVVQLTTNLERADTRRFYARLGFVPSHAGMKLAL